MKRSTTACTCLLILLATTACDTAKTSSTAGDTIALGQLQTALADAVCTAAPKCPDYFPFTFASPSSCVAMLSSQLSDMAELAADVQSGKVVYDGAQASKCVAAARTTCSFFDSAKAPAGCDKIFIGSAALGASCTRNEHCKGGFCKQGSAQGCPGICTAQAPAGQPCVTSQGCTGSLVCSGGTCAQDLPAAAGQSCTVLKCASGLYCDHNANDVCAAPVAIGAPCAGGSKCAQNGLCSADLQSGATTCKARPGVGQACSGHGGTDCQAGLACIDDAKGGGPVCVANAKLGQACASSAQCGGVDAWCSPVGTCELLPTKGAACSCEVGAKGGPCAPPQGQEYSCLPPYSCDATSKKCVDPPSVGQSCANTACASGLSCAAGTCKAPPGSGEDCATMGGDACAKGLACTGGKCTAPVCK